jgi:hypothetical protein
MGWTYGKMIAGALPDEPPGLDDGSAAAVLDEAEDFLNSVGPQVLAEVRSEEAAAAEPRGLRRIFRRRRR